MVLFNTARAEDSSRTMWSRVAYQVRMCARFVSAVWRTWPEVVHVKTSSGVNFYQNACYVGLARVLRRPVVLQLHSGHFPEFVARQGWVGRALISATLRAAHRLLGLSTHWAEILREMAGHDRVDVVPNVVDAGSLAAAKPDRSGFGIPEDRVAVLFVGTRDPKLDEQKGLSVLLEAMVGVRATCPNACLVLAGRACAQLDLSASLGPRGEGWMAVGVVHGERKAALFRSVDVFVLPSDTENMPNTVLEAMAAGAAVVATPVGAVPEMIVDGVSGVFVPVRDVEGLGAALVRIIGDPAERERMANAARRAVTRDLDIPSLEAALMRTYAAATGEAGVAACGTVARVRWWRRVAVQRRLRLLARLYEVGPRGVAHRMGRMLGKRRARAALGEGNQPASAVRSPRAVEAVFPEASVGFFGMDEREQRAMVVRSRLRGVAEAVIGEADAVLRDGVRLLGKQFRPADANFDWQADPEGGRLWPSTVMDDADAVRRVGADVKFVWEVNRQQFVCTLARAWTYGRDARHATAALGMVRTWIAQNPPPVGVNWASNLEVAIRSLSWTWALHFLLGAPGLDHEMLRQWLSSLRTHRDHLVSHLSTFTDPTNHLIGEAAALAVLGLCFPTWPQADAHTELAVGMLAAESERQIHPDGVSKEQSTSYQRFVFDLLLQVIVLLRRRGRDVPSRLRSRAIAMIDAFDGIARPGERMPQIGDSDDARGLPFASADLWDFGETVAMGRAVLGHGEPAVESEAAIWLGGGACRGATAQPRPDWDSVLLPAGGYAVLRRARDRLVFDVGPLGYLPHASHGHSDLLAVLVDVAGEEVLVDRGTFAYWDTEGRRNRFRSTAMHNTVEIGGRDQADAFDPFKWLNIPGSRCVAGRLAAEFDWVEAWHDGYRRLRPGVRHRRGVLGVDGGWVVVDWLEGGRGWHRVVRSFHAAPAVRVAHHGELGVVLRTPSGNGLVIRDVTGEGTRVEIGSAEDSASYGRLEPATVVRLVDRLSFPSLRVTLFATVRGEGPMLSVESLACDSDGRRLELRLCRADGKSMAIRLGRHGRMDAAVAVMGGPWIPLETETSTPSRA
ncbi:MAG: heparinase II/III family protein [Candidatus Binatia bacterium]